jgi:dTDP-glucose 4,6-dehydratase
MGFDRLRDIGVYDDKRIHRFTHDFSHPFSEGLIKEFGRVSHIAHIGAETHVDNSITDPRSFVMANVVGTCEMLELARKLPELERFVYFSTDEVFGPAAWTPNDWGYTGRNCDMYLNYREWDRYNSTNPYAATKAGGEELCLAYANTYKVPLIITHCMNLFGERQHPEKFIPGTIRKVLNGETVYIHSDASRTRPGSRYYLHARSASDAVLYLLGNRHTPNRDKFNIVGQREVDNLELAKLIAQFVEKPLNYELIDFHSSRPGHDLRYGLDGSKLKDMGWEQPICFEHTLQKTVDWFLEHPTWLGL